MYIFASYIVRQNVPLCALLLFSEILFLILLILSPFLSLLMLSYYPHLFRLSFHELSSATLIRINNLPINIVDQLITHTSPFPTKRRRSMRPFCCRDTVHARIVRH